jgi:TolB-like protein/DNA-binding winged helix-turn-helix (wHTH) protein/Tfp pilus assembly protein PilF
MSNSERIGSFLRFQDFELSLQSGELRRNGIRIKLQDQPFKVLVALLERPGQVVTREELRQLIWPEQSVGDFDHAINLAITKIRSSLGDSADVPHLIETLPRRGYRFIAPVQPGGNATQPVVARSMLKAWGLALLTAALLIGIVLFGVDAGRLRSKVLSEFAVPPRIHSIAVLPLTNMSGDPEQEYFTDGMTEELITELSQVTSLKVISRTSVMRYKRPTEPLPQIARELGVDGIIEGSVLRSGTRVRVNVQLIHAPSDLHLWAKSYERSAQEILTLQRDVAQAITTEIQTRVTPEELKRLNKPHSVDPKAHELYLKGRYEWNKRSEAGLRKGLEYFQEAIDVDPTYALAYSGLADSYLVLGNNSVLPGREVYPKAKAAALKALELDETSAEAHASLSGVLADYDRDWDGALKELRSAIKLNSNYATAHHWYGMRLAEVGRNEEALQEIEQARRLDPLSIRINANAALILSWGHQYDQAIIAARKALELEPNDDGTHTRLGEIYLQKGMSKEAIAEFQLCRCTGPYLARAYAAMGDRPEALRQLRKTQQPSTPEYISPLLIARVYVTLGEKEKALAWLQKGFDEYAGGMDWLKVDPALDPMRSDSRFQNLMRHMNFPQQ